jgi:hypothetical protein
MQVSTRREHQARLDIEVGFCRLSAGIEDVDDLVVDLSRALARGRGGLLNRMDAAHGVNARFRYDGTAVHES